MGDLSILDPQQNLNLLSQLKPDVVFVGLNVSKDIGSQKPFSNFHPTYSRAQDYKTRFALKDTELWGGYMTDIIKDYPELHGQRVGSFLRDNPDVEKENIETFLEELKDLGTENRTIIAFGEEVYPILKRNLQNAFTIVKVTHYSAPLNLQKYREEFESIPYLVNLINFIKEENIVYPMTWHEFYVYIKNNVPKDVDVPVPFILGASGASDNSKREQFIKQIEIANKYGLIQKVSSHIMNLSDDQLVRHETKDVDPETGNLTSNPEYFPYEEYERIHLEEEVFGECVEYLKQLKKLGNNYVNSIEYFRIFFQIFEKTLYSKKQQKIHENNLKKIKSYSKKLNEWYDLEDNLLDMEVMKEYQKNIESEILIYKIYELYTSLVNKDLIDDGLDFCETLFYYLEEEKD